MFGDNSKTKQVEATHADVSAHAVAEYGAFEAWLRPGVIVRDRYEVLGHLGSGGLCSVILARHLGFDENVALKFLLRQFCADRAHAERFVHNARAAYRLRGEHVARIIDVDTHAGTPFVALELLSGTTLRKRLDAGFVLSQARAVDCMLQVCEAVSLSHGQGLCHHNLKPENIFFMGSGAEDDLIKVSDFGNSRLALGSSVSISQLSASLAPGAVERPAYLAPEQLRNRGEADTRADVWSIGCVLYELLTGISPFERGGQAECHAAVLAQAPIPVCDLRSDVARGLGEIVLRCLSKAPEGRFPDVAALAQALGAYGSGRFASYPALCRSNLRAVARRQASSLAARTRAGRRADRARREEPIEPTRPPAASPWALTQIGFSLDELAAGADPIAADDGSEPAEERVSVVRMVPIQNDSAQCSDEPAPQRVSVIKAVSIQGGAAPVATRTAAVRSSDPAVARAAAQKTIQPVAVEPYSAVGSRNSSAEDGVAEAGPRRNGPVRALTAALITVGFVSALLLALTLTRSPSATAVRTMHLVLPQGQ